MIEQHTYRHLDEDSKFQIQLDLRDVAERIDKLNYGTQRFLSHLVDVRRERHAARIAKYEREGHRDIAENLRREGDELAEEILNLLNRGLF